MYRNKAIGYELRKKLVLEVWYFCDSPGEVRLFFRRMWILGFWIRKAVSAVRES